MGWSFNMDRSQTKAEFVAELNRDFGPGYECLAHRVVGNNLWQLVKRPDGEKFICLYLMSRGNGRYGKGCSDHGWGYKGISEDMGPAQVNCPLSLLNAADPPRGPHAPAWREKVREHHAAKKRKSKAGPGTVVEYGGKKYKLIDRPYGARRGWRTLCLDDGYEYRMKAVQLSHSTLVSPQAQ